MTLPREVSDAPMDQILELLKDGEWHEIKDIAKKTQLNQSDVELIMNFLTNYDFIELDTKEKEIRLTPSLLSFLKEIQGMNNNKSSTIE